MKKYTLSKELKSRLQCQVVLENMINFGQTYPIMLDETTNQDMLKPLLEELGGIGAVEIKNTRYVPTQKGRTILSKYLKKYQEFIKMYDVFNAVDVTVEDINDAFALSKYWDFEEDEDYENYTNKERFQDLRWQILEFKGLNPIEYMFMSFINEGKLDLESDNWEFELVSTGIFDEILDYVNDFDGLAEDELEEVMPMIIEAGVTVSKNQKIEEDRLEAEEAEAEAEIEDDEDEYEEITEIVEYVEDPIIYIEPIEEIIFGIDYYDSYYDPYYYPSYWNDDYWY